MRFPEEVRRVPKLGRVLVTVGMFLFALSVWKNGNGISVQWHWWHPVGLLAIIIFSTLLFIFFGIDGFKENTYSVGIGRKPFWFHNSRDFLRITRRGFYFQSELRAGN